MAFDGRPLALVTGASHGIGLELARQLASDGYDLLVAARSERLDGAADELRALGAHVDPVHCDLATRDGVETLAAHLREIGRLDVAAINAGVGSGGAFAETDLDDDLRLIDLNVR